LCCGLAFAQPAGTEPKPKAEDYETHGRAGETEIGAEFMIHSFSGQGQMYVVKDYLVVEVALYPPKGNAVRSEGRAFLLRINGRKPIVEVPASLVASAIQHPDWQEAPHVEGGVGSGNTDVIFGRPRPTQVPGGQPPRLPNPPRAPNPDPPGGIEREPRLTAQELIVRTAFPRGEFHGAISGFVYFPYRGKTGAIKSLELLYGETALKLR
jgi:hypothetical protein